MEPHLWVVMVSSFPTIQDSRQVLPGSLLTSISIAVSSFTLSSDQFRLSLLLSPMMLGPCVALLQEGLSRVRLAWSWTGGFGFTLPSRLTSGGKVPRSTGPWPELVRRT